VSVPRYSLVIPFYNEAGNAAPLLAEAWPVLRGLDGDFEAVLVDDHSTDATGLELAAVAAAEPRCRVVTHPHNLGQAASLHRGLTEARGAILLTMDGDGQNDPADFPRLLAALEREHADLVCGWRRDRRDSVLRRVMSRVANGVRRRLLRDGVHDAGCQLRVFRREVLGALRAGPMMQSLLPAMVAAAGFAIRELPVNHRPRTRGSSTYGGSALWFRPAGAMLALWWQLRRERARGRRPGNPARP
jgi:dolichol-phosphate mannosyltransferase